ncbi:MAG: glycosyltransferase, partial [Desulfobacterales bacterium]|nr:glycosyltransferase [Desulfobacterales bacterium]
LKKKCVKHQVISIMRRIHPVKDIRALLSLYLLFRRQRFDIVHSTTPKAGLICAMAGFAARIPYRFHTWTGQAWVTRKGLLRYFLKYSDKFIAMLSTKCYADSPSQCNMLVNQNIIRKEKIQVINKGSLAGVDTLRFNPDRWNSEQKLTIRKELGVKHDSKILIYVGRITKEKGIVELIRAFNRLVAKNFKVELLIVGPKDKDSGGDDFKEYESLLVQPGIHCTGYTDCPERYMAISDIYCLASYREGFGTTVIEAAAMKLPAVGSRINGLIDAVEDGITGVLVQPYDDELLSEAIGQLLIDPEKLKKMGLAARERCLRYFDCNLINSLVAEEYVCMMSKDN